MFLADQKTKKVSWRCLLPPCLQTFIQECRPVTVLETKDVSIMILQVLEVIPESIVPTLVPHVSFSFRVDMMNLPTTGIHHRSGVIVRAPTRN